MQPAVDFLDAVAGLLAVFVVGGEDGGEVVLPLVGLEILLLAVDVFFQFDFGSVEVGDDPGAV